ncbi:TonB-dependent receptor [Luteimonas aestuarii]|uniref:TonB-dependent receptor n=1 Tax=Luteimonas aestuarii TaxID=453837 RepID=A0A4R5TYN0_9GAMM|nr:TonB-dependent receptor [Luteimonas aestuarii]TDK26325.1 TonB-dependent receptor [Luteimonas aestuarii]
MSTAHEALRVRRCGVLAFAVSLALAASPALSQDAADEGVAEERATSLDTVTVTATRRALDIDRVPVAVTAIGGDDLVAANVQDTQSLSMLAPSLVVTTSGSEAGGAVIRMRGIGTAASNPGLEGSVGVLVDGIYRSRSGLALTDLVDIDQIEVLRGPQSTLFGKNTSSGVINIQTKKPTFVNEGFVAASLGNFDSTVFSGAWSGPVVDDTLALRFSAQYNQRDGYVHNTFDGRDYNNRDRWLARAQALWTPTEDFSLRLIADAVQKRENCCAAPYTQYGATAAFLRLLGGTLPAYDGSYQVAFDAEVRSDVDEAGLSALMEWDLGWATLNGTLSYRDGKSLVMSDGDFSDVDIAVLTGDEGSAITRISEFTLRGQGERIDWMVGAYLGWEEVGFDGQTLFGALAGNYFLGVVPPAPVLPLYTVGTGLQQRRARQSGRTQALYTHNIVHFDHGIDLTLGLRHVREDKDGYGFSVSNSPSCTIPGLPAAARILCGVPLYSASYGDERTVGVASLAKNFDGGGSVYFTYSTGFKAGGINLDPANAVGGTAAFEPETVTSYELGLKKPLFDRRLFLRAALFRMDYDDVQLNTFDGLGFRISNEASARSQGVELEADWYLAPGYKLRGGYTYNKAEYGEDTFNAALHGRQITNAPKHTGLLGFDFDRQVGDKMLFGSIAARYQGEVNTGANLDPAKRQDAYTLVNARVGLRFRNDFEVSLWGNNLTDEYYNMVIFDSVAQAGSYNGYPGLPRTWGIDLRKRF